MLVVRFIIVFGTPRENGLQVDFYFRLYRNLENK